MPNAQSLPSSVKVQLYMLSLGLRRYLFILQRGADIRQTFFLASAKFQKIPACLRKAHVGRLSLHIDRARSLRSPG